MTAASLDARTADRLAKLLGLLGSDHDGECVSAARKAHELVCQRGLSWFDVIACQSGDSVESMIDFALAHDDQLTAWEEGFLRGIRGRQHLTERQLAKLDQLVAKLRRAAS